MSASNRIILPAQAEGLLIIWFCNPSAFTSISIIVSGRFLDQFSTGSAQFLIIIVNFARKGTMD
jgi:hypothetical protein